MILSILEGPEGQSGNERRKYLQVGLLALALLLVAVLGFRQVKRWVTPSREVWVASSGLPAGATVGSENLKRTRIAESALPKGALLDARAIAGRELQRPKEEGEPFVRGDFAAAAEAQAVAIAEMVPEGRVLTTIRVPMGLVPYKNLKVGDRVDLVAAGGGGFARVVAHDAYVVGTMYNRSQPQAPKPTGLASLIPPSNQRRSGSGTVGLLLALTPEDALPLAQATSGRGAVQVVLHGRAEVASGDLIELPEHQSVEYIAGASKRRLAP